MTEPATRTPISWTPPDDMSFDAWEAALGSLMVAHDSLPWLLGDCLNAGKAAFGEDYSQALPDTRKAQETYRVYKWVAEKVPVVTRVTELSWSHHRAVAGLEPPEQARWLARAQTEGMSLKALTQALKPVAAPPAAESEADQPTTEPEVEILPPTAQPALQITFSPQGGRDHWRDAVRSLWRAGEDEWQREMLQELGLDIPAFLQRSA